MARKSLGDRKNRGRRRGTDLFNLIITATLITTTSRDRGLPLLTVAGGAEVGASLALLRGGSLDWRWPSGGFVVAL